MNQHRPSHRFVAAAAVGALAMLLLGCEAEERTATVGNAESCMSCHNGAVFDDYSGPGLENPHPFPGANNLRCTECHGGNASGVDKHGSHVPPPPEIGDREQLRTNREAYFNRLTLTGIDKFPDYTVDGQTYTALDYLQFVNPGDLRVTQDGRSCGECHAPHSDTVHKSLLATEAGVFSGASFAIGRENQIPAQVGLYSDTAADLAFRAAVDPSFVHDPNFIGPVGELIEMPVYSKREEGAQQIFRNEDYLAAALNDDVDPVTNQCIEDSPLAHLFHEQTAFTCGDCHLGSAGANNRSGDYRSSGCTACHMPYSLGGRTGSRDPNVDRTEPVDPDDIRAPERAHVKGHRIVSSKRTLVNGVEQEGIDDYACAGCHQGSNRTVMQFWGIRLDQNQDVRRRVQYPANPQSFTTTRNDERLFDPEVGNREFNGRNHNQYLLAEDYDGDGRDDTPADVHYDAGMGCIDCHGSVDLHGGDVNDPNSPILSRMEQAVTISCEACHGGIDARASTASGTGHDGQPAELVLDQEGRPIRHVRLEADGNYYLYSKLTGRKHYLPQTLDTVVDNGKTHPSTGEPIYTQRASYSMGRADGQASTGLGPQQAGGMATANFSHTDNMSCASCHSSWTNTCMGCHLEGEFNGGNNFSNITGERIVFREREADFVYQSPLFFQLGVGTSNKIEQTCPNTVAFFQYRDQNGDFTKTFAFSDRQGKGNDPNVNLPSMGHSAMLAHSIRGKVSDTNEGPRYCTACHLTDEGLSNFGRAEYDAFRTALATDTFTGLDFDQLKQHFGQNTGNELNSPLWVHMAAGLGSGVFLFDEDGCPINPIDEDDNRKGCDNGAPADNFDLSRVAFNMDRIVNDAGQTTASNTHPMEMIGPMPLLRDGATDPTMAGPLGADLVRRLTDPDTGIVLDSWIDPSALVKGQASTWITDPP